jgi:hypothetical protein
MTWDLFISHASEDKADVARPLADLLHANGFKVWYDEYTLTLGDNLRQSIEQGLSKSEFAVVILSPSFFSKKWTNLELDGLFALEKTRQKKILPVWHNCNAGDVESYSSFMAMRLGVPTSHGLNHVVDSIRRAVEQERSPVTNSADQNVLLVHPHSIALLLAAQESDGMILAYRHLGGFSVQVAGKSFGAEDDPRAEALNIHCLKELVTQGLAEQQSESMFVLTEEGFEFEAPSDLNQAPAPDFSALSTKNVDLAKKIMQAAVAGDGSIMSLRHLGGHTLQAGNRSLDSQGDLRIEARFKSVLRELETTGLVNRISEQICNVSHVGFLWVDGLNLQDVPTVPEADET